MLLKHFTPLELTLANYFGPQFGVRAAQNVSLTEPRSRETRHCEVSFHHFNIEQDAFPFDDQTFDVVLFCEILEHLHLDPVGVLREIGRVLKPGGRLVLTTPNVSRLENVCRIVAGANIYDPYSGYGTYGRHNREYNKDDLARLLAFCGFDVEVLFSADVHANRASDFASLDEILPLLRRREHDLGQYLFSRSVNTTRRRRGRPAWLYRSYAPDELEQT
jgi:SAM-dependent methyltransferase